MQFPGNSSYSAPGYGGYLPAKRPESTTNTSGGIHLSPEALIAIASELPPEMAAALVSEFGSELACAAMLEAFGQVSSTEFQTLLLKLLKLPKELHLVFVELMQQDPAMLKTLEQFNVWMAQNPDQKLSLELLQQFLKQHLQNGQKKASEFLLMPSTTGQQIQHPGMNDALQRMAALDHQLSHSPQESLKTLVNLYLPVGNPGIYPPVQFQFRQEPADSGNSEKTTAGGSASSESQLVMYLKTVVLGRFRISLSQDVSHSLLIETECDALVQPYKNVIEAGVAKEKPAKQIPKWLWYVRKALPSSTEQASCTTASESTDTLPAEEKKPSVLCAPPAGVSIVVVETAHRVATVILALDTRLVLHQQRNQASKLPE
jgi:hypothetical protein